MAELGRDVGEGRDDALPGLAVDLVQHRESVRVALFAVHRFSFCT
ncbi:hypothetical protein [Microbispora bryophytorum]